MGAIIVQSPVIRDHHAGRPLACAREFPLSCTRHFLLACAREFLPYGDDLAV